MSAPAPRTKSIENGKLQVLSPSLLNAFDSSAAFGCERRGWFKYVKGLPEPTTDAMTRGTHLHAMNEEYLRTGKLLLGTPEQTAWFNAGRHFLDKVRDENLIEDEDWSREGGRTFTLTGLLIEAPLPADFAVYGVPVSPMSKCDVVMVDGIIDWKTTSDIEKYGKTPGQLAKDVQMLIYAKAFHPTTERVTLTHGQYQTKGRVKFQASSVELTRNELDTNYEGVIFPLVEKVKAVAAVTDVNEVTPNRNACRTCPHSAVCPTEKASIIMSIFDRLKKSNAAVAAPTPPPAPHQSGTPTPEQPVTGHMHDLRVSIPPGGILPPDAPPSKPELAAKPVEGFSQKEGFEAVPPPRRNLIVNAPTSEPSPSADLASEPAEAPKPSPAPEPEKKRGPGRPPGAKNKPKVASKPALGMPIKKVTREELVEMYPEVQGGGIASDGTPLTMDVEKFWKQKADAQRAAMLAGGLGAIALGDFNDGAIQFESVTVNYGLTLKLGDAKSFEFVRFDCSMTARGADADATYAALLEKVKANVSGEIEKLQADIKAAQTLNPNGKEK